MINDGIGLDRSRTVARQPGTSSARHHAGPRVWRGRTDKKDKRSAMFCHPFTASPHRSICFAEASADPGKLTARQAQQ